MNRVSILEEMPSDRSAIRDLRYRWAYDYLYGTAAAIGRPNHHLLAIIRKRRIFTDGSNWPNQYIQYCSYFRNHGATFGEHFQREMTNEYYFGGF